MRDPSGVERERQQGEQEDVVVAHIGGSKACIDAEDDALRAEVIARRDNMARKSRAQQKWTSEVADRRALFGIHRRRYPLPSSSFQHPNQLLLL